MKAKAKPSNAQPALVVDSEVVRQIRQHARSSSKTEVCGVLIGQDRDHRIDVAACIEGQNAVKDQKYPEERIVGWYHSHPGFGVFLSDHDTFIHRNFFSSPGQVAWVFDPHSDEEGCFGWVGGRIERLKQIGVVDRRGGEEAHEGERPETGTTNDGHDDGTPEQSREKVVPLKIRRRDAGETRESSDSSLERLVAHVFFYLAASALGFALAWYVFPRVEVMPVLLDPRTGQLIDIQTGQVIAEPRGRGEAAAPAAAKPEANHSAQPSSSNPDGKKGNDAQPK
jgi:proteasome lid subunit RPN8/RPN11